MPPRTVHISQADGTAAKYEFLNHPDPIVQKRMLCLRLKYRGYENQAIADIVEVSRNTIGNYLRIYEQSGFEGLKVLHYQGPVSKLDKHQPKVESSFRQAPPRSVKEAGVRIKKLTGIKRSATRVRAFLKRMGMNPFRPAWCSSPPHLCLVTKYTRVFSASLGLSSLPCACVF